ncbi:MAG: hypothetical protein ACR2PW_08350 [Gammaproteobacteria bacterium]
MYAQLILIVALAIWGLGLLPLPRGYLLIQLFGWQFETYLSTLLLAGAVAGAMYQPLKRWIMIPIGKLTEWRHYDAQQIWLAGLSGLLEEDWQLLQSMSSHFDLTDPQYKMLQALILMHQGQPAKAAQQFKELEQRSPLAKAARLKRIEALWKSQNPQAAHKLLKQTYAPSQGTAWLKLQLQLLIATNAWDEIHALLDQMPKKRLLLPEQEQAKLLVQVKQYKLTQSESPELILQRWHSLTEFRERQQTLDIAVKRLFELGSTDLAATLIAEQLDGELRQVALPLCFELPPGAQCQKPLEVLLQITEREQHSTPVLKATAWLLLCTEKQSEALKIFDQLTRSA